MLFYYHLSKKMQQSNDGASEVWLMEVWEGLVRHLLQKNKSASNNDVLPVFEWDSAKQLWTLKLSFFDVLRSPPARF
jgi:hypothetical protein